MANSFAPSPRDLDLGFRALTDATRRAMLARLSQGRASVMELAEPFDMALPTITKHLRVLEEGGLISTRKKGRVRMCSLEADRLKMLIDWMAIYEQGWRARLDQLGDFLETKETDQ